MKNPFIFGEVVRKESFADRETEIKELTSDLESGQNILLFSPRRYGKTSLIMRVLEELKGSAVTVYCDLMKATSKERFAEIYGNAVTTAAAGKLEELVALLKEHLPAIEPKIVLKQDETVSIEIGVVKKARDIDAILDRLYDLPEKVAERKGTRFVVVFDEFQEIVTMNGEEMLRAMRTKIQHHRNVAYVFMGSRRHIFQDIFTNKNRVMYRIGKLYPLAKIPKNEFSGFIEEKFRQSGIGISSETCEAILDITEGHPAFTQQLCHELWYATLMKKKVELADIKEAKNKLVNAQSYAYETMWDSLASRQKALLLAIAEKGSGIYSREVIEQYALASSSNVRKAIVALETKDIIEKVGKKYEFSDIFFREWLLTY